MKRILIVFSMILSVSAAFGADKEKRLSVGKADSYPTKQAQGKVIVAAVPYVNDDELKEAFGKANPYKFGILPVMLIIQNDSDKALRLDIRAAYVDSQGKHIEAIPATDVGFEGKAPSRPGVPGTNPIPLPKKKNPMLNSWEIVGRAFSAKMAPAGEMVSGFVYFHTPLQPGSQLYLTGLSEAQSGKELFYFEIPLTQ
jgi:hypothetical protein